MTVLFLNLHFFEKWCAECQSTSFPSNSGDDNVGATIEWKEKSRDNGKYFESMASKHRISPGGPFGYCATFWSAFYGTLIVHRKNSLPKMQLTNAPMSSFPVVPHVLVSRRELGIARCFFGGWKMCPIYKGSRSSVLILHLPCLSENEVGLGAEGTTFSVLLVSTSYLTMSKQGKDRYFLMGFQTDLFMCGGSCWIFALRWSLMLY